MRFTSDPEHYLFPIRELIHAGGSRTISIPPLRAAEDGPVQGDDTLREVTGVDVIYRAPGDGWVRPPTIRVYLRAE